MTIEEMLAFGEDEEDEQPWDDMPIVDYSKSSGSGQTASQKISSIREQEERELKEALDASVVLPPIKRSKFAVGITDV